jgi:hypothetical protein
MKQTPKGLPCYYETCIQSFLEQLFWEGDVVFKGKANHRGANLGRPTLTTAL